MCTVVQLQEIALMAILLEFPLSIVQWAHLTRFQPTWNAMEMECMLFDRREETGEREKMKHAISWMEMLTTAQYSENGLWKFCIFFFDF